MILLLLILILSMTLIIYHSFNNIEGIQNSAKEAKEIAEKFAELLNLALTQRAHTIFDDFVK